MPEKMIHVLLVFDHDAGRLMRNDTFQDSNDGLAAYAAAEQEFRELDRIEVVLVGSDSLATIRRTHANYFEESITTSEFLAGL